ncbi:MAG TPA: helix-turn-helix domain-containing protein [Actinopolymorphaceae bacterium]
MKDSSLLAAVGVSALEEAAYVTLLRDGAARSDELARRLGDDAAETIRILERLELEGLVRRTPAPGEAWVAVPPHIAVEQLVARRQAELARVRHAATVLAAIGRPEPSTRRTTELIEIVQGREAVRQAFEQVQRSARKDVLVLDAPPYANTSSVNATELGLLASGVTYRGVYAEAALAVPGGIETIAHAVAAGEEARLAASVPTKLAIADQSLALLPLAWSSTAQDTAVLVHPCGLLDALVALFESTWTSASPLVLGPDGGVQASGPVTDQDRRLLSLLVAGLTDEAVAARLRISRRTIVRRVQHLMTVAGARSRIQLGWRARELGWL